MYSPLLKDATYSQDWGAVICGVCALSFMFVVLIKVFGRNPLDSLPTTSDKEFAKKQAKLDKREAEEVAGGCASGKVVVIAFLMLVATAIFLGTVGTVAGN